MDARKYLELFLTEAREHVEQIARAGREISSESAPEVLQALFRSFHSLKGMAASMEFNSLSALAHAVEDLYDAARQGKRPIDPEFGEITLDAADLIGTLLDEITASGAPSSPTEQLTRRVRELLAGGPEPSSGEAGPAPSQGEGSGPAPSPQDEAKAAASAAASSTP
ncbi:MAG: Hpt domain-containing protein [Acidobacteriota bacterium]